MGYKLSCLVISSSTASLTMPWRQPETLLSRSSGFRSRNFFHRPPRRGKLMLPAVQIAPPRILKTHLGGTGNSPELLVVIMSRRPKWQLHARHGGAVSISYNRKLLSSATQVPTGLVALSVCQAPLASNEVPSPRCGPTPRCGV